MPDEPKFEPDEGHCEALTCVNPAEYRALWPGVSKLVCQSHRKAIMNKSWPEAAPLFESPR
jgi:hypothetical protein